MQRMRIYSMRGRRRRGVGHQGRGCRDTAEKGKGLVRNYRGKKEIVMKGRVRARRVGKGEPWKRAMMWAARSDRESCSCKGMKKGRSMETKGVRKKEQMMRRTKRRKKQVKRRRSSHIGCPPCQGNCWRAEREHLKSAWQSWKAIQRIPAYRRPKNGWSVQSGTLKLRGGAYDQATILRDGCRRGKSQEVGKGSGKG